MVMSGVRGRRVGWGCIRVPNHSADHTTDQCQGDACKRQAYEFFWIPLPAKVINTNITDPSIKHASKKFIFFIA